MSGAQLTLPMKDSDRWLLLGARVRSAARSVAKAVGYKRVAVIWGHDPEDEAIVSQKLDETNRRAMKPNELLALMGIDDRGVILAAICETLHYEMPERKIDPGTEEQRIVAAYVEMFGPEVHEVAKRKAGV